VFDYIHDFADFFFTIALLNRIGDAVEQVIFHQQERNLFQRGLDSADLIHDVNAIDIFCDHPLDASRLPFDST
jgi:hypothetical protein